MGKPESSLELRVRRLNAFVLPLSLVLAVTASGSDEPARAQALAPAAPTLEDDIARSMDASRPGAEQRSLDPLVGTWNVDLRWLGAGRETRASGTSENRWILGGRFLLCESTAGDGPSRVEATTIYGFDGRQKRFFSLALNNLATSYEERSGTYDPVTQSFLLSGRERDESTGSVLVQRQVLKIEGPDRHVLSLYVDAGGRAPVKLVEAVFTRR
jgi:hypothetical protein